MDIFCILRESVCFSLLMLVYSLVESEVLSGFQTWVFSGLFLYVLVNLWVSPRVSYV